MTSLFIEPGSPWENGYNECFNRKLQSKNWKSQIRLVNGVNQTTYLSTIEQIGVTDKESEQISSNSQTAEKRI